MMTWRRLTGLPLIVTISACLALCITCHVIAISTQYWIETESDSDLDLHGSFLRLGLWTACFNNYQHRHERPAGRYDGCHSLYSQYYANIRDWLIPRQSFSTHCSLPVLFSPCDQARAGINLGFLKHLKKFLGFLKVFSFLTYKYRTQNYDPQAKRFEHVNATSCNSYFNIICIKLVAQVKK